MRFTFDEICESQDFEHDAEFVRYEFYRELEKNNTTLEQKLQETKAQLVESNELLINLKDIFQDKMSLLNIDDSCFSRLRRWNNDSQKYIDKYLKDKQEVKND